VRPPLLALGFATLACTVLFAQMPSSEVRVSVVLNADGSRTVYETDSATRKSTATTTEADGKVREKIRYELDANGRFLRGEVFGPKEQFRFRALYKYDGNGRLTEEIRQGKDGTGLGKLVFQYDAAGHQTGYIVYDEAGKLVGQTTAKASPASPAKGPVR
jgi:YD repeat-containing protein